MRIVMDDAGDVPEEIVNEYNITVIPINVTFGTEEFLTGVTIDRESFYEKVKEVGDQNFPKTSQPTPYQFSEVYKRILAEGEKEILTITVGKKLSGTYDSALAAGKELAKKGSFHLFDSAGATATQGYMIMEAARMAKDGQAIDTILARLEEMRISQQVVFLIDNLEYAVRGGRVGSLQSTVASLLRIKPIMKLENGEIVEAGRVRTYSKALDYIVDYVSKRVEEKPIRLAIIHAGSSAGAATLLEKATARLNVGEEMVTDMCIPVAINLGPGALGIVAIPE
jgi:DegV family protein with EDD domain